MTTGRITYLADPPRRVPWTVIAAAIPGLIGMMGAAFFLFGMLFMVLFSGDVRPLDELRLSSATTTATATVTDVLDTNASENDETVYEYRFTFRTRNETEIKGTSYSTGQIYAKGERVPVTYLPDKPSVAQLQDTRHTQFPWWTVLMGGIFPFIGTVPNTAFVPRQLLDAGGLVKCDARGATAMRGVFAAGAARAGYGGYLAQAQADGIAAAQAAHAWLQALPPAVSQYSSNVRRAAVASA